MSKEGLKESDYSEQEPANPFMTLEELMSITRHRGIQENLSYIQERLALALVGQAETGNEVRQTVMSIITNLTVLIDALGEDEQRNQQILHRLSDLADLAGNSTFGVTDSEDSHPQREVFEDDPGLNFRHYPETDED